MESMLLTLRLALGVVLVVAAGAKLMDVSGSKASLEAFGVPRRLLGLLALAIPMAEVVIGLLLVQVSTAQLGAIAAAVLFLTFVAAMGLNLLKGRTAECHCFGRLHSAPVTWWTMARTGGFAACALLVAIVGPGNAMPSTLTLGIWAARWPVFASVVLAIAAFEGWLIFHLMGQHGRMMSRIDSLERLHGSSIAVGPSVPPMREAKGLERGTPAPDFEVSALAGGRVRLEQLLESRLPVVLFFSDPECGPCSKLLPTVAEWQQRHGDAFRIAVVTRKSHEYGSISIYSRLQGVLLENAREIADLYQAFGTPSAVLILPDGTVGSDVALGADAIRELVRSIPKLRPTSVRYEMLDEAASLSV